MDTEGSLTLSDEVIERVRAELAGLTGPARLVPLTKLGQALAQRLWRGGLGLPAGRADLDEGISAFTEAHGYMRDDDSLRGNVAAMLGMLLSARHSGYTNDEQDCELGVRMLEEALGWTGLSAPLRGISRIQLGQLLLARVMSVFQTPGVAMNLMTGGLPPGVAGDADRAAELFRQVIADPSTTVEMVEAAESMLAMADMVGTIASGTGLDVQRLMDALTKMQKLRDRFTQSAGPGGFQGTGSFLAFSDMQSILRTAPMDRPVPVVVAPAEEEPPRPRVEPVPAPEPVGPDRLRQALHDKLGDAPAWTAAAALLLPGAPLPDVDTIDELAALARMVVDAADGDSDNSGDNSSDSSSDDETAVDWFVLAVTLYLRDRLDQGGDRADRLAGAESLLTAVGKVSLGHPACVLMLRSLGAFLDEDHPLGGVLDVVAEDFGDRLDAAVTARVTDDPAEFATLHALRCLCRAATAAAELGRAAVPSDYPWHAALKAAGRVTG